MNVVASIQYRALAEKASDAFYKLSNTKGQIQAYVFDGKTASLNHSFFKDLVLCRFSPYDGDSHVSQLSEQVCQIWILMKSSSRKLELQEQWKMSLKR